MGNIGISFSQSQKIILSYFFIRIHFDIPLFLNILESVAGTKF